MIADVGGDAPGSVLGEQLGCRAPSRLLLEIDVSERLPTTSRTMKLRLSSLESTSSTEQGGGKRRSGKAQRSCCQSMTLSTIFECSAIGDPGVITKLAGPTGLRSAPQTVRSLVLPPIRMTPFSPSDRISPSAEG